MRFGLAIASLVISGLLLLLGLGQRTVFAGPAEIAYASQESPGARYGVIAADQFSAVPGQANLLVGGTEGFAAIGSTADIEAWVAPFAHVVLTVDEESERLTGELVAAESSELSDEELEALDPRGSDLWLSEVGSGRAPVAPLAGQSVLVDLDADRTVSLVWAQSDRTPWAGPLLAAGGAFALLGLVLYLLAVDHDRRGLGPRRGRSGPLIGIRNVFTPSSGKAGAEDAGGKNGRNGKRSGNGQGSGNGRSSGNGQNGGNGSRSESKRAVTASRLALPSLGLAAMLALSGCSSSYWPDFSAEPEPTAAATEDPVSADVAPVPITQPQIDRIIDDVVAVAGAGDDALDKDLLKPRFTGDAYTQRSKHYKIREQVEDYEVMLPRITSEQLGYELVQSTDGWPRTVFVTVASEAPVAEETEKDEKKKSDDEKSDDEKSSADEKSSDESAETDAEGSDVEEIEEPVVSPSLAMILVQQNPHENYMVKRLFALRGGISMPSAAPVEEGTARLADDMQTLVLTPGEVGPAYAEVLVDGDDSEQAQFFDLEGDTIIEKSGAAWVAAAKKTAKKDGYDVKYSVEAEQTDASIVSLSTGLGGALVSTTVMESRIERQTGKYQPKAVGAVTALSGLKGAQKKIVSDVAHQLLFFVPSDASGEKIQLLGYTTELVGAGKK